MEIVRMRHPPEAAIGAGRDARGLLRLCRPRNVAGTKTRAGRKAKPKMFP